MDAFPRIELFSAREWTRVAVVALAAVSLVGAGFAYLRPAAVPRAGSTSQAAAVARAYPRYVSVTGDGRVAYAVAFRLGDAPGEPRALYRSEDGGRTWKALPVAEGMSVFGLVALARPEEVAAIGLDQDWVSRDGGRTWRRASAPIAGSMQFVPGTSTVFLTSASAEGVMVAVSHDEGATWRTLASAATGLPVAPGLPAAQSVSVSSSGGQLWLSGFVSAATGAPADQWLARSLDGGATWHTVELPPPQPGGPPLRFSMPTIVGEEGWMIGLPRQSAVSRGGFVSAEGSLLVSTTTDGGAKWSPVRVTPHAPATAAATTDWWAAGGDVLYRSTDLGLNWTSQTISLPSGARLQQLFRLTPTVAYAVYGNFAGGPVAAEPGRTRLLRTTDGGHRWSDVNMPGA